MVETHKLCSFNVKLRDWNFMENVGPSGSKLEGRRFFVACPFKNRWQNSEIGETSNKNRNNPCRWGSNPSRWLDATFFWVWIAEELSQEILLRSRVSWNSCGRWSRKTTCECKSGSTWNLLRSVAFLVPRLVGFCCSLVDRGQGVDCGRPNHRTGGPPELAMPPVGRPMSWPLEIGERPHAHMSRLAELGMFCELWSF